ncbi:ATP-binding cassette domain-containing protein [Microbacterium sp. C7(2022)]|uniref:ATP-binding cassette domain-containing protein n=1 Tax=Microbacterium sp. C7(2022) TaxID=2992759 RepID=UPI00237A4EAC|nr:ATP-binding cassette domain-containing protein [Microbacterium sp. C7(2022)]MDE0545224.1 ATP-binding cassette domain-containing protein [Microbacterium sp. C7(2022)]
MRGSLTKTELGVAGVRVTFGDTVALDDVTIDVPRGRVTSVVGGDGAGKSTLLRILAGRLIPDAGDVCTLDQRRIGYQPSTSGVWGNLSVIENVRFVGQSYGMSAKAIRTRGDELLERAGLTAARARPGAQLSGGMRQKLGFLLAILHEPELILLDEPSTGVDPVSRVELWRLISTAATGETAVLMATTYLDEAQRAASVTALEGGRVLAAGEPDGIIAAVPGTIARLSGESSPPVDSWRRGTERHGWYDGAAAGATPLGAPDLEDALIALTVQAAREQGDGETNERAQPDSESALGAASTSAESTSNRPGAVYAAGHSVTRRFGSHVAVDDVSLDVRAGEIVGLIGANGAGKTTFLRTLIGLDSADEGDIELFGKAPDAASRRRLGYVPQGLGLYQTLSVDENVGFFARVYETDPASLPPSLRPVHRSLVKAIGLGRQRQLAFALALEHEPDLLVLDEPTSGVDPLSRARLWDIIHAQAEAGRGVIVTTHYLQEAEQCTRLALMSHGKLLGVGSVAELTAGLSAVRVRATKWQRAFLALGEAGLATTLDGRTVRVAGSSVPAVRDALGGIDAEVDDVAPTLEEAMVLLDE